MSLRHFPILISSVSKLKDLIYKVTAPCYLDDFCYANTGLIQDYLNLPGSFAALSVPSAVKNFSVGSTEISDAFELTNDRQYCSSTLPQYNLAQFHIIMKPANSPPSKQ